LLNASPFSSLILPLSIRAWQLLVKNSWSRDSFKKVVKRQVAWQASTYYVLLLEHQIVEESLFAKNY